MRLILSLLIIAIAALTASAQEPASTVLPNSELYNPGFEGGWWYAPSDVYSAQGDYLYSTTFGEIFTPQGWTVFMRNGLPVPWDGLNDVGFATPEVKVINWEAPFTDPPRIHSQPRALQMFTFWRIHDAGLYQQVEVPLFSRWRVSAWVHAWTAEWENPYISDESDPHQASQRVGIDPYGGTNPFGKDVVWSEPAHIYDVYARTPAVEATAMGKVITVFLRCGVLWPYKHNDHYWDTVTLESLGWRHYFPITAKDRHD